MIGIDDEPMTAEERDREMAIALQRQLVLEQQGGAARATGAAVPVLNQNVTGRLTITVVEAKLTKNYGVTRMDPYARLCVGQNVYETPTCQNGAREPKWNKTINCFLMAGSKTMDVEIYDECTFSPDSLIAHASIPLTDQVIVKDDWWPLSGQEGEEKEGMIHLILSMKNIPAGSAIHLPTSAVAPSVSEGKLMNYTTAYGPPPVAAPSTLSEENLEEFSKMFPSIDKEVIEAVFVESRGDKEATVNALLQIGS